MNRKWILVISGGVLLPFALVAWIIAGNVNTHNIEYQVDTSFPGYETWNELLTNYVEKSGDVDYDGFIRDSVDLNSYLYQLSANPPSLKWSKEQQLTYWINAYNAFTIQLIIRNYPLLSIKEIGGKIQVPFINSPWDIAFIRIGNNTLTLNNIEHQILRKQFDEPRIHFAIVCASTSCPRLRNEAYRPEIIEEQLQEQAVDFVNDPSKNIIGKDLVEISKIFQWFGGDFTNNGSLIDYLNKYSTIPINRNAKVRYLDYDWNLNSVVKDF